MIIKRNVRSINGFIIRDTIIDGKKGVIIVFLINGVFFTQSQYQVEISEGKMRKLEEKLNQYVQNNKDAQSLSEIVALPTMVKAVEDIISY